jgi:hypothetical protein
MILLCGAVEPRMRRPLAVAVLVALLLPFASGDPGYVVELYRTWALKMWHIGTVLPGQWPYQADFTVMLASLGIVLPGPVATVVRAAAALGTLWLAICMARSRNRTAFALGVLLLTGCYLTLFGPRNEYLSFFVLTPPLTALALLLLARDIEDGRAWLMILAALVLGFDWPLDMAIDGILKPAVVVVIYAWLARLAVVPERWRALVEDGARLRAVEPRPAG